MAKAKLTKRQKLLKEMQEIVSDSSCCTEEKHIDMDNLLLEFVGCDKVSRLFNSIHVFD